MAGRRIAGLVAIMGRHPRRGPAILIVCGLLLVFGVILVVVGRGSRKVSTGS